VRARFEDGDLGAGGPAAKVAGIVSVGGGAVLVAVDRAAGFVSGEGIAGVGGESREKPGMGSVHNDAMTYLAVALANQLDRRADRVRTNSAHIERSTKSYYIPDVFVVPAEPVRRQLGRRDQLEVFQEPLSLVIEVWSRSPGNHDAREKIPEYRQRGDLEIWRLHPYERTLTVWRRKPDGSYAESHDHGGKVCPAFLPDVTIDLDELFDFG
ncbi:MAG: putative restriction endonuclease, partial [Thermomicrobiales bacterium]|nr:putative restriction endonuclease [Thermomicrobiales bacterium]